MSGESTTEKAATLRNGLNINARKAVMLFGDCLIGRTILTESIGEYPGGLAEVLKLNPDEQAPEIVLEVKHPTYGTIGIFGGEIIKI